MSSLKLRSVNPTSLIQMLQRDLVILDIIMPHLNGLEVLERLYTMDLQPFPHIIAISPIREDKMTQRALALGAEHYIVKPFELDTFIKIIRQMFLSKSMKIATIDTLLNIYSISNSLEKDYDKEQELISISLLKYYHNNIVNNPYNKYRDSIYRLKCLFYPLLDLH